MARKGIWLLLAALTGLGCAENGAAGPQKGPAAASGSASAPAFSRGAPSAASGTAATEVAPASASAPGPAASAAEATGPSEDDPVPDVEVTNIGMHIGGEENTPAQKKPIREAVHEHYDDFRRCYGKLDKPPEEATFGVDMRIGKTGGRAKISNPRNTFDDDSITPCLIAVFERIEFPRAKKGIAQMVSFSLRFRQK